MSQSITSPQNSPKDKVPTKIVVATVLGNALEFFDFLAYAFFAVYIGRTFFPATNEWASLLSSLAVFGVGFLFRPVGAIMIGAYADRKGRKPAMLLTILLITIGTIGLAITPSYATIGIAAPIIVVICRLIQGFALGGEVGPASAFLIEISPKDKRAFYSSWQLASQGLAAFMAGAMGVILALSLPQADLATWGWRIPFAFCLLLIPIGIYLRKEMPETLEMGHGEKDAPKESLLAHKRTIILAILLIVGGTVSTYVGTYMTTYALTTLKFPPANALFAAVVSGLATFIFALLGGLLADKYGRRITMIWPRVVLIFLTVPAFMFLVANPSPTSLFLCVGLLAAMTGISGAASLTLIPELIPRSIRATVLSIAYAVGVSIFGGSTQFIVAYLLKETGNPLSPAWYVVGTSIITLIAMFMLPETKGKDLKN